MKLSKKNVLINIGAGVSLLVMAYCFIYILSYYQHNDILFHYPRTRKLNEKFGSQELTPSEIGDSIGGVLAPIIGMLTSILTFLAFYIQKRANDVIQLQFKTQQFESQFYEMLRLHKENVNEIELNENNSTIKGRMAFHKAVKDFHFILENITPTASILADLTTPNTSTISPSEIEEAIFCEKLNFAYRIFFWDNLTNPQEYTIGENKNTIHSFATDSKLLNRPDYNWHAILGHYYRHLFHLVKSVVSNSDLDYNSKMSYLKLVRAQLSNYEQIMLFYNWLAEGYGSSWEEDTQDGNKFFTEYKMIHNLWYDELYPERFLHKQINELIDKYNLNPKNSPLFEFQGSDFHYKIQIYDGSTPLADKF